ncbi:MAG: HEAT repeat domain-containing protein [Planctomycetes bacterium]|nr:HEAT repeat domain-containing protein [Planctomycetota bacterium]
MTALPLVQNFTLAGLLFFALLLVQARTAASEALYDGHTVPHWQAALKDSDPKVRRRAAYALGYLGPAAAPAVPALSDALGDRQLEVAWYAADALGHIGPAAAPAVEGLVKVIEESPGDTVLRRNAVIALGRIGPGAKGALSVLEKTLKSEDAETRVATAEALGKISRHESSQKVLIAELKPAGGPGPLAAALALRGSKSADVANALIAVLDSPDADLRRAATETLSLCGVSAIVPLISAVEDKAQSRTSQTRVAAVDALGRIASSGRKESEAALPHSPGQSELLLLIQQRLVPALIARLADPDDGVQASSARAVAKAGLTAVPELVAALLKDDARGNAGAQMALGQIQPYLPPGSASADFVDQKKLVPQLIETLRHRDPAVRVAGFRLFAELGIGKSGAAASDALRAGLTDPNADIRRHAAAALARLEQP